MESYADLISTFQYEKYVILINLGKAAQNKDQTRAQIEKQDHKNDIELGSEFQIGNSKSQSQKKSGQQVNKK